LESPGAYARLSAAFGFGQSQLLPQILAFLMSEPEAETMLLLPGTAEALAQAALFTNQIPAFEAAPSVYTERAYLQTFVRATAPARKYLLLTTNTQDVITFDLQESIAQSLLNLSVPAPKTQ